MDFRGGTWWQGEGLEVGSRYCRVAAGRLLLGAFGAQGSFKRTLGEEQILPQTMNLGRASQLQPRSSPDLAYGFSLNVAGGSGTIPKTGYKVVCMW